MNRWLSVLVLSTAAALTGCGSSVSTASVAGDPSATPSDVPSETSTPTSIPSVHGSPISSASSNLLGPLQSARVLVDGLAVRTGPSTTASLVAGYQYQGLSDAVLVTTAVRVDAGYFLWIEDGPLVIKGVPWYRVTNTLRQTEETPEDRILWDADGDEFRSDFGWVSGGDGTTPFLVADEPPPPPPDEPVFGEGPEPYVLLSGIGNATSDPFELFAPVGVTWFAADPDGQACDITITLQPAGIDMGSAHVEGWGFGDEWWPQDYVAVEGDHWLEIRSDCSWSLRGHPVQG